MDGIAVIAGIVLDSSDTDFTVCPKSFSGKLLAFLKAMYDYFNGDINRGFAIIPCELIDQKMSEPVRGISRFLRRGLLCNWGKGGIYN